ncbi:MAG: MazG family protein [Acidimicrobiales bacterium]
MTAADGRPRVVVAGLGPAGDDLVTVGTVEALGRLDRVFLRTDRHPAAVAVAGASSFDHVYEAEATLEAVYRRIVEELVAATESGTVGYAVPGSPVVAERTVLMLLADDRVDVTVVPALSFADLAWARLRVDPVAVGARLVDGHAFEVEAAGERGPLLVAQCDSRPVLSEIKLAVDDGIAPDTVTVLQRLGLSDEAVFDVGWPELDRAVGPDHLTSLWIPRLAAPIARDVARFAALVRVLRERCPWDREQTHHSLTRHLLEETYEALEAIEALDESTGVGYDHVEEELGDLLFQVVFHTTLAAEAGQFTLADVARRIHDKLVGRHPHVFGDAAADTAEAVVRNWEQLKRAEKGRDSVMDGISSALPALLYAHKVQRKAAALGIEAPATEPPPTDVGDALFELVAAARRVGVDPEIALRAAAVRFRDRVQAHETDPG